MPDFGPYFEEEKRKGSKVDDLKPIYATIRESFPDLPNVTTGAKMRDALREYEESHPDQCQLEESEDELYGVTKGANLLQQHIQWVYVPAVKDASTEQDESKNTTLGDLLDRTIRSSIDFKEILAPLLHETGKSYKNLVDTQQNVLTDLSTRLEKRLKHWAHSESTLTLQWQSDPLKQIKIDAPFARVLAGERGFQGELARLGHGMQRSFLVAILQELASGDEESGPRLLLAVEEPELYQHPPQARQFAALLEELSTKRAQTIVTTHSPYFVSARGFEAVRMARPLTKLAGATIKQLKPEQLTETLNEALGGTSSPSSSVMARLEQILQPSQAEMFFSIVPILVEGLEDVALISTCFELEKQWSDFRAAGCHFVTGGGKKNLSRLLGIAQGLYIPAWLVFDADGNQKDAEARRQSERDNECLLRLCGEEGGDPFPSDPVWGKTFAVWPETLLRAVKADIGAEIWNAATQKVREENGWPPEVQQKNQLVLAAPLTEVWDSNPSPLLKELCSRILDHAKAVQSG
jgi:predicted ATP-dependent endonuclease of OLD family